MAIFSGATAVSFLARYWKHIAGILIVIALCGALIGVGMKYSNALKDAEMAELKMKQQRMAIQQREQIIASLETQISYLQEDDRKYRQLIAEIQKTRGIIQTKYDEILGAIDDIEIPVGEDGTVTDPYIVIPNGVPDEYRELVSPSDSN